MVDNVANGADGIVADAEEQRDYQRQRVVVADHRYRDIERRFGHPGQRQQFQDDWAKALAAPQYGRCRYRGADVQLNDAVILGGVLKTSGSNATIEALSDTDEMAAAPPLPAPLRSTTGLH
jgi:hypothetical protein